MNPLTDLLDDWQQRQLLTPAESNQLENHERIRPVSLYILLRTLLYAGILLFTSGAGLLIYNNINTIGHDVLIGLLALLTAGCFYYTYRHSESFSTEQSDTATKLTDFVLLLGCTLFLSLESYVQWQYNLFGTRYGLATVIPAVLFLFCAYRFDHQGVLSMGLTALASWVGLTVAPLEVLSSNNFDDLTIIHTAIFFSLGMLGIAAFLDKKNIKRHFTFTYMLLVGNLLFISALAGLFSSEQWYLYALLVGVSAWYFFYYAQRTQSFLFLLMAAVYGYIAFTYLSFKFMAEEFWIFGGAFYFAASAAAVVWFLINYKKLLKVNR